METTDALQTEHNAVLYVLDQLEQATGAAAAGQAVPADVFTDVGEFFRVFVDKCHHGKEETVLFPRLKDAGMRRTLEAEHDQGRQLAKAYTAAVAGYVPGDTAGATAVQRAARDYGALLRQHIARETDCLLPTVERELAADDHELAEAFERIETERIGAGTHERLHGMIETLPGRVAPFLGAPAGSH
jgi:hemerythrin-like domain-containing protein